MFTREVINPDTIRGGFVYILRALLPLRLRFWIIRVKIGRSGDVARRFKEYQTSQFPCPVVLDAVVQVSDQYQVEKLLHEYYQEYRLRWENFPSTEWFDLPIWVYWGLIFQVNNLDKGVNNSGCFWLGGIFIIGLIGAWVIASSA